MPVSMRLAQNMRANLAPITDAPHEGGARRLALRWTPPRIRKVTRPALLALLVVLQPLATRADDLQYLGSFHNVSSKDGGEHCAGYSLALWKYHERILGLLDVHEGLCGDPPCGVIRDVRLDSGTGHLGFWSLINGQKFDFQGTLTRGAVDGAFNGERARLAQDRDRMTSSFGPDRNVLAWCKFWSSVPRCGGVRELCGSINVQGSKRGG